MGFYDRAGRQEGLIAKYDRDVLIADQSEVNYAKWAIKGRSALSGVGGITLVNELPMECRG